jgi:hypothetical protein
MQHLYPTSSTTTATERTSLFTSLSSLLTWRTLGVGLL